MRSNNSSLQVSPMGLYFSGVQWWSVIDSTSYRVFVTTKYNLDDDGQFVSLMKVEGTVETQMQRGGGTSIPFVNQHSDAVTKEVSAVINIEPAAGSGTGTAHVHGVHSGVYGGVAEFGATDQTYSMDAGEASGCLDPTLPGCDTGIGGGTGGGQPGEWVICFYYDYFDIYGNFLYREYVECQPIGG